MTTQYFLWPGDDLIELSDEFAVRQCRIRLSGASLTIEHESTRAAEASQLVQDYADSLRRQSLFFGRLLTTEEFGLMPAQTVTVQSKTPHDLALARNRLGAARRSIVEQHHQRLSQCYDYLQLARDDPDGALGHIYKLIETIEGEFGGERASIVALNDSGLLRSLKRLANQGDHDQRHAPEPGTAQRLDINTRAIAIDEAHALLHSYEKAIRMARS